MDKSIHLRLPETLYSSAEKIKDEFGFTTIQEFIKDAVRKAIQEYYKQRALYVLRKNFGSMKNVKRLTDAERDELARKLTPAKSREILKKFGF